MDYYHKYKLVRVLGVNALQNVIILILYVNICYLVVLRQVFCIKIQYFYIIKTLIKPKRILPIKQVLK